MAMLPNPLPSLADDPTGRALGLDLPPGTLVDDTIDEPWHEPLLWYAEAPAVPGDWRRLLPARRTAGLQPVLLGSIGPTGGRPEEWDLNPEGTTYAGDHDAEEVLAEVWEAYAQDELSGDPASGAAPVGPWPGLAAPGSSDFDPDGEAAELADILTLGDSWLGTPRLALVPARRSADIPAAIGWSGPLNFEDDVARLSAVLRSWEDRFGIRVVALTFDQLVVSVAAPPTTTEAAEALAVEHFAFCPDNIQQGTHPTLSAYAKHRIIDQPTWSFWWD
ncbi:DUF4253 domain-containing protein [Streptomyces sp. NPDC091292]|uniref:DUF4253 domain-containing protein n=1 Tax=Streptomyces sp. NPDC091292 TaxID=3365991 RepID=UPI00382DD3D5